MTFPRRSRQHGFAAVAVALAAAGVAACGSGSSGASVAPGADATSPASGAPSVAVAPSGDAPGAQILVTNDDGVDAPGIDALVLRLQRVPQVQVAVVAPDTNKSGSGGRTTPGSVPHQPATTASGAPATAVTGYPADTVRVALDDLHLHPAVVVSGINKGQNIGPLVDISGTVGAARAAARRGIPAIAVSQGAPREGTDYDFTRGADVAAQEVEKLLPRLAAASRSTVLNINVPSCRGRAPRGLLALQPSKEAGPRLLEPSDCTTTATPRDEVGAFLAGFAVQTVVPATP